MHETHFDPQRQRESLLNPIGGFEWMLDHNFSETKAAGGLEGSAEFDVGAAIQCLLVGFDEPAERLLKQAAAWMQVAIDTNERPQRYFPNATEAARFNTLALCNWLLSNRHDTDSLARFVGEEDIYLNRQKRKDKIGVSLTLLTYVDAGAFERTLEIFGSTPNQSPPATLSPRSEAAMAYILSRHQLGLQYSREEVQRATDKFLAKNIDQWLDNGHSVRAAQWLKIICWNDSDRTLSAKQVVMKAYDYLPGCSPPAGD